MSMETLQLEVNVGEDHMDIQLLLNLLFSTSNLRKRDTWTRTQLEMHQAAALRRLRDYAYVNSRFYQKFLRPGRRSPLPHTD